MRETDRQTDRQRERQRDRDRQTDKEETDRQRQTDRQTDRQRQAARDRQPKTETDSDREWGKPPQPPQKTTTTKQNTNRKSKQVDQYFWQWYYLDVNQAYVAQSEWSAVSPRNHWEDIHMHDFVSCRVRDIADFGVNRTSITQFLTLAKGCRFRQISTRCTLKLSIPGGGPRNTPKYWESYFHFKVHTRLRRNTSFSFLQ